jgi:hypothetical protein
MDPTAGKKKMMNAQYTGRPVRNTWMTSAIWMRKVSP